MPPSYEKREFMAFVSMKELPDLTVQELKTLRKLASSRSQPKRKIHRAKTILLRVEGKTVSQIARDLGTNRPNIERTLDKCLAMGLDASLDDLPRPGRKPRIGDDARNWITSLACQKPKELGYPHELWTRELLAQHIRKNCNSGGFPVLSKISKGTVTKILLKSDLRPHKISYYLERRDPEFESKMQKVLLVYKEVEMEKKKAKRGGKIVISYDEKPGMQAIGNTAPDLPPVTGKHSSFGRDHEYERFGTLSLLAGIDLFTGHVHATVEERHRSIEFIGFLKNLAAYYPPKKKLKLLLDNHSAHLSEETQTFLKTRPNKFEFVFTPKHASWLNIVESLFSKMARSFLRGIRVSSKAELRRRLLEYIAGLNESPKPFVWTYKMSDFDEEKV